ncbi:MAG: bile acid:sodium symporter family protein [Pseudomonadota bacterium]
MGILVSVVLPLGLAFIMFSLGLGLTLDDFRRVLVRPVAFLAGAVSQLVIVPLVAFAVVLTFGLTAELAVGMMILAFCPGGVTSNIMAKLARGDVALSVSLTAVISLVSMITVPFLVAWSVMRFMGADAPAVSITGLAISMFLITTLPVLIGVAVRHFASGFADRFEPSISKIATGLFVVIVLAALASNWALFVENLAILAPSVISLNVVLIILGALLARVLGLGMKEIKTVAIETGVQNSTVGITLGTLVAAQATGFSPLSLPAAVYGITMYFVTLPAILWFRRRG